jgi:hypothetical protein
MLQEDLPVCLVDLQAVDVPVALNDNADFVRQKSLCKARHVARFIKAGKPIRDIAHGLEIHAPSEAQILVRGGVIVGRIIASTRAVATANSARVTVGLEPDFCIAAVGKTSSSAPCEGRPPSYLRQRRCQRPAP